MDATMKQVVALVGAETFAQLTAEGFQLVRAKDVLALSDAAMAKNDELAQLRLTSDEGERLASRHLERLRELTWEVAARRFDGSPGWTSGEECLDFLAKEFETLRAERDQLRASARSESYRAGRLVERSAEDAESRAALIVEGARLRAELDRYHRRVRELEARLAAVRDAADGRAA